jgi:hypothetical protein
MGLNDNYYYTAGYAEDIAILINIKFPQTVSEALQTPSMHSPTVVQ